MAENFADIDLRFPIDKFVDRKPASKENRRMPVAWRFRVINPDPDKNQYWADWALVAFDPSLNLSGTFQVEALYNE